MSDDMQRADKVARRLMAPDRYALFCQFRDIHRRIVADYEAVHTGEGGVDDDTRGDLHLLAVREFRDLTGKWPPGSIFERWEADEEMGGPFQIVT